MEMVLDKIMHRRGNTLTYEHALRLEGIEDSPDILLYWIKIDDRRYQGKKEGSKKFDEIAVGEGGREVVVDYLMGKEVQRKNLSKGGGGTYSIDRGVILLVRWIKRRPIKMKVGVPCTQTRFKEGISAKVNLEFKSLKWREFTSLASQDLMRKQDLWGEMKSLFSISVEAVLKEEVGKVKGVSITQAFQHSERKAVRRKVQEAMGKELKEKEESYARLQYYHPEVQDIYWGDKGCK